MARLQPIPIIKTADEKSLADLVFAINDRLAILASYAVGSGVSLSGSLPVVDSLANDVPLGEGVYFEISTPQACTWTGLAGGFNNRPAAIKNVGSTTITLAHESGSSREFNRFKTRTGAAVSLAANDIVSLIYSSAQQRWIVLTGLL